MQGKSLWISRLADRVLRPDLVSAITDSQGKATLLTAGYFQCTGTYPVVVAFGDGISPDTVRGRGTLTSSPGRLRFKDLRARIDWCGVSLQTLCVWVNGEVVEATYDRLIWDLPVSASTVNNLAPATTGVQNTNSGFQLKLPWEASPPPGGATFSFIVKALPNPECFTPGEATFSAVLKRPAPRR